MIEQLLVSHIFAFMLAFSRLGTCMMLLPGFGEIYVPVWVRLSLALSISLIMMPLVHSMNVAMPTSGFALGSLLIAEATVGVFIAMLCRILIATIHTLGTIISIQSGLAAAMMFDVNQASQGTVIGNMLSITAIVLWFVMDFHHLIIRSLYVSYDTFLVGGFPPPSDMLTAYTELLRTSFSLALQLSAPIVVVTMLINVGGGILSRLMPTMQVFFLLMPAQILFTFFLITATVGGLFLWYLEYVENALTTLIPQ